MLSGLPGDGKSYLARRLAEACGAEVVESDAVRLRLTGKPRFTRAENRRVFDVCHTLIERLLSEGRTVIMDATNLVEAHRGTVYVIAERTGARLIIVRVDAPERLRDGGWKRARRVAKGLPIGRCANGCAGHGSQSSVRTAGSIRRGMSPYR